MKCIIEKQKTARVRALNSCLNLRLVDWQWQLAIYVVALLGTFILLTFLALFCHLVLMSASPVYSLPRLRRVNLTV